MSKIIILYSFEDLSGNITINSTSLIKELLLEIFNKAGKQDDANDFLELDSITIHTRGKLIKKEDLNKTVKEMHLRNNDKIEINYTGHTIGGFGGFQIVDISQNKVKYIPFSKSAPKYRIVDNGLNIKSICKNPSCEANGQVIFIIIGFVEEWDLFQNMKNIKCPICTKKVVPKNFGFSRCKYIIKYTKVENDEPIDDEVKNETTGDKFQLFDEDESGKVEFMSLIFTVKKL